MSSMELSVVMPVHNEAKHLPATVLGVSLG